MTIEQENESLKKQVEEECDFFGCLFMGVIVLLFLGILLVFFLVGIAKKSVEKNLNPRYYLPL